MLIGIRIAVACDPPHGYFADNLGAFLGFRIHNDLIRSVNLVVREDAVLKYEPSRSPSFAVIDPFVQYPGDSVPDEVVDLHVHHHRRLLPLAQSSVLAIAHGAMTVAVAVVVRIGSNGGVRKRRRHGGEVRKRSRRGFDRGSLVGNGGDAAERMHEENGEYLYYRDGAIADSTALTWRRRKVASIRRSFLVGAIAARNMERGREEEFARGNSGIKTVTSREKKITSK